MDRENYAKAQQYYTESLALLRELDHKPAIAHTLNNLGIICMHQADYQQAYKYYSEGLDLARQLADKQNIAEFLENLGRNALFQHEPTLAFKYYVEYLELVQELGDREGIAHSLTGCASIYAVQEKIEPAAKLWGAAEGIREAIGTPLAPADHLIYTHTVATARALIDQQAWAEAWAKGRAMAPEQAIALAKQALNS